MLSKTLIGRNNGLVQNMYNRFLKRSKDCQNVYLAVLSTTGNFTLKLIILFVVVVVVKDLIPFRGGNKNKEMHRNAHHLRHVLQ